LSWFQALSLYKMAAATALIVKHKLRDPQGQSRAAELAPRIPVMLERARALLGA
jgi:hypothetical protein